MFTAHQSTIISLAINVMESLCSKWSKSEHFVEWLENESGIEAIKEFKSLKKTNIDHSSWKHCIEFLKSLKSSQSDEFIYENRICALGNLINLTPNETQILAVTVFYKYDRRVEELIDAIGRFSKVPMEDTLSQVTQLPRHEICAAFSSRSNLCKTGLLDIYDPYSIRRMPDIADHVSQILQLKKVSIESIAAELFGSNRPIDTLWEDFDHIGSDRTLLEKILRSAMASKAQGINILIYGTPGTGKTEFCKLIAKRLNAQLSIVGETDEENLEPTRNDRLKNLLLAYRLLPSTTSPLVLFDEMEDLFPSALQTLFGSRNQTSSKVFLNRMLETTPIPTLWTANNIEDRDPAFLRRMTFSIEFKKPPLRSQTRIWKRVAKRYNLELASEKIEVLAKNSDAPPAIIANAIKQGANFNADDGELEQIITSISKLTGQKIKFDKTADSPSFDTTLLNTNLDLNRVISKCKKSNLLQSISFCLSGLPGTGKSEYARYFAEELDMPILHKRASDILGKYVGESESNIAMAFEEAIDNKAVLIFDEADSLLQSRELAKNQWEISQVNEMLTWMEKHPLPFFCTTNLASQLDIASLRRFTFKVEFAALSQSQKASAYKTFFGFPPPEELAYISSLTPGDFWNVKRRIQFYDNVDDLLIIRELKQETKGRPDQSNPIGFSIN